MSIPKPPPGHFNLLYFAAAKSFTKRDYESYSAPQPVSGIFDLLDKKYPGMKEKVLSSCALTVNYEYVDMEEEEAKSDSGMIINEGDEVGIIPPVSSG